MPRLALQSSNGVAVSGRYTNGAKRTFNAHYVIITVPLGVLKANRVAFSPALSSSKRTAIRQLGFGTINKVVFFFNKVI